MRWIILLLFFSLSSFAQKNYTQYVNPFVGTAGHAHTFPGACYPFGMMQLSPDTRLTGWDGCSGYYYSDTVIYGFTHTHLSGTGCSDYGDILLMPVAENKIPRAAEGGVEFMFRYYSSFSHSQEKASPGYYSVLLKNGNILADLTVGEYAGLHRYTFTRNDSCGIVLDLAHRDRVIASEFKQISDTEICGYRESQAWARDQIVYFDIRFSKPVNYSHVFINDSSWHMKPPGANQKKQFMDVTGTNIKVLFDFNWQKTILVKIGISAVSIENAKQNLEHDIPGWDFDGTLKKTQQAWNDYLGKIEVSSKDNSLLQTFYTALYHTAIHPSLYTDVNGEYRGRDMKTHKADGFNMYTVFSIWDTYRALHPLFTIIDTAMDRQFIQTFLKQYEQGGVLPVWELSANETNCMIGYHSVSVIWDAYQKGIRGFNANEAFEAMKHSAEMNTRGLPAMRQYGYIPADKGSESVSQTLELGYDDWCIAQMANALGKVEDYNNYIQLAQAYKNEFNPNNQFMQGRANGRFCVPFDPRAVTFNYTEANAWQYSFYAPHDMNGLIELFGSKQNLAKKLDTLFTTTSVMTGRQQPDITGMIGQYAQGNEPSHHIAYLYNYVGQPWKTGKYVHEIEKFYTPNPDGICGNDDCGELSAWYVMSAIGMYQVCPGDGQFELTTPLFDTVKIHLESGKTFTIYGGKSDERSEFIESTALNGKDYKKSYLRYTDLMKGGSLRYKYTLVNRISDWGTGEDVPMSSIAKENQIEPQPYFEYANSIFLDSLKITVKLFSPESYTCKIANCVDSFGHLYKCITCFPSHAIHSSTFYIDSSCTVGYSILKDSADTENLWPICEHYAYFTKIPKGRKIKVISKPNSQYTAGGPQALIDFQHGSSDFRLGAWQGYQYTDFEAVVDLGKEETISQIGAEFMQDAMSWILMPKYAEFSVSTDSIHFTQVAHVDNSLADSALTPTIETLGKKITPQKVRYIKVFAKNYGKLPPWHPGYGDEAFIFIDEIEIK